MKLEEIREAERAYHMQVYGRQQVAFERGRGAVLVGTDGREYLDFLAGIAVMNVGHSHPKVVDAIAGQAAVLTHVSNLFYTEPQVLLAQRLHDLLGWGQVFFCNSGAEANECALKLARRAVARDRGPGRCNVVAAEGSFHGRTFSTLAATGQPAKHEPFAPLPAWFAHVPLNDEAALEKAVGDDTCAVLLEVVQGEGGVKVATPDFLATARKLCDERGALLIFDEVQTGVGRTGRWFAFQHYDVVPDVITLAKALGAGLPIGACIAREEVAAAFARGDHATTFGGGPVPCAAALAVLDVVEEEGLVDAAQRLGDLLVRRLTETLVPRFAREVRGAGLLVAVELNAASAAEVAAAALKEQLVVNNVTPSAIRLAPPLVVSEAQIEQAVERLARAIRAVETGEGDAR